MGGEAVEMEMASSAASALRQRTLCPEADTTEDYALQILVPEGDARDCFESLAKSANKYGKSFKFRKTGWASGPKTQLTPESTGAAPNAVWDAFFCRESSPYVSLELAFRATPQERALLEARMSDALLTLNRTISAGADWTIQFDSISRGVCGFHCRWEGRNVGLVSAQAKPTAAVSALRAALRTVLEEHGAQEVHLGPEELSGYCAPVAEHDADTIPSGTLCGFLEELLSRAGTQSVACNTLALVRVHGDQRHQLVRSWDLTDSAMVLGSGENQQWCLQKHSTITQTQVAGASSAEFDGHFVVASELATDIADAQLDVHTLVDHALQLRLARQEDFWKY